VSEKLKGEWAKAKLIVIENGEHKGKAGDGQFLKRGTCVKI